MNAAQIASQISKDSKILREEARKKVKEATKLDRAVASLRGKQTTTKRRRKN